MKSKVMAYNYEDDDHDDDQMQCKPYTVTNYFHPISTLQIIMARSNVWFVLFYVYTCSFRDVNAGRK